MEQNLEKNELVELTAEIVSAYVSNNTVVASDLPGVIHNVFDALSRASAASGWRSPPLAGSSPGATRTSRCPTRRPPTGRTGPRPATPRGTGGHVAGLAPRPRTATLSPRWATKVGVWTVRIRAGSRVGRWRVAPTRLPRSRRAGQPRWAPPRPCGAPCGQRDE